MKDQIICSAVAAAGAYLFFVSPILDSKNEPYLAQSYGRTLPAPAHLVQLSDYPRANQEERRQQQQEQFEQYLRESERDEPQYIWTPDGRLQGWQQPDSRGQVQQYDLDGNWKGTIYK